MENLKTALLWVIDLAEQLTEDLKDGKLQRREAWGLIPKALGLHGVIKSIPHIPAEFKTLRADQVAKNEVVAFIAAELDINNDDAERKILAAIELAFAIDLFIQQLKA